MAEDGEMDSAVKMRGPGGSERRVGFRMWDSECSCSSSESARIAKRFVEGCGDAAWGPSAGGLG